jgi:hypothetical protein
MSQACDFETRPITGNLHLPLDLTPSLTTHSGGAVPNKFRWMPLLRHTQTQRFPKSSCCRSFFEPIRDIECIDSSGALLDDANN